ncbi:KIAA0754 [Symbiodinium microadriaticum]|nr:KIAA0754 [Symbiodinium microadriaticum]CAE7942787.1 KIAA0754 [Symbiodinium sp. KB8]
MLEGVVVETPHPAPTSAPERKESAGVRVETAKESPGARVETPESSGARVETVKESASARVEPPESSPGARVETAKESAGARVETPESSSGARVETPKESAGARVETPESSSGARVETPKESQTQVKQEIAVKQEPGTVSTAKPVTAKKSREEETEEEHRAREAHNSYMRYYRSIRSTDCPPEVREKCLTPDGKRKSTAIMRHGEAVADDIVASKKAMDQGGRGVWWKVHPDQPKNKDWELFKCFDSREELTESEDELEFGFRADVNLDHAGTTGALSHILDRNAGGDAARGSNDPPPPPNPNPRDPRKTRQKSASEEAVDLLKKGPQRFIEADGMASMLQRGGMGKSFANAMVADMQKDIEKMKQNHAVLQKAVTTNQPESDIEFANNELKQSYAVYDDKMKAVKRTLRPPAKPKSKAKGKAKVSLECFDSGCWLESVQEWSASLAQELADCALPVDSISLVVRARPDPKDKSDQTTEMSFPIIAPHLLVHYLLREKQITVDRAACEGFWRHFQERGAPWMEGFDSTNFVPLALYGDEAEYTITKEKILVLFISNG